MSLKQDNIAKVIVVGMSGTGKTSVIKRYTWNQFDIYEQTTIGMQNNFKEVQHTMRRKVQLRIWDIAGQDKYKSMTKNFVRNSSGCIIVCDTQREDSLKESIIWKNLVQQESELGDKLPVVLAQNKYDLLPDSVKSSKQDDLFGTEDFLNNFAEKNNFNSCIQVSAKDGYQVEELFSILIDNILQQQNDVDIGPTEKNEDSISLSYYESQITKAPSIYHHKKKKCC
ncbi:ADP-ribosylation factor(Arf)/Arf-like (ARL) small GTPase family protein (macronuclear) [Tetrahymena thermophila SB210]|uniref:ADP-ribosylation factor(Arf)/Arf-like (ARL) small GTPase family protein n=2 Tax=Tetrahymena thermophila TaxID=5911 RepID=Q22KF0_TETTS|nr:ADP-ribosylation factor(Arf)/Arf-like (ARL) small GTPase family protein [Tetrahymena thermophila SB210]EAR85849.2 ADP-ribosylation factor(Arf)/Arf-like (ARL) small GTPase family protein [Tetrahymena thermophila SB210]BAJ21345.1 Rab-family small GTPase RabX30 [Tetrahymena thermophila]|eukprot:XP_001033512.2 ADP-ribosylation factor(Arf)/Arf-like (ARL) small GTPase family protein [Tetrahymena thermophila SB210]